MTDPSSVLPDILDVHDINELLVEKTFIADLLQEYNPEIEENYKGGREVDMRVWTLVRDIKMMIESSDVWFVREY
tara:strand:- start:232 stop:456 length:225 start_codon:yes stop_codon:yes gene_type:complete